MTVLNNNHLSVKSLISDNSTSLKVRVVAGSGGLHHSVKKAGLHRPGLALTGFTEYFPYDRIQIIGRAEILYLRKLSDEQREINLRKFFSYEIPCLIVSGGARIPSVMKDIANEREITILSSNQSASHLTFILSTYLNQIFAPNINIHGTMVDVYGTGLLFVGRAGIGKSEIALDLVERGHRLVADDVVTLSRRPVGILTGSGPEMLKHLIEIRGVGIINVRQMFGVRAIRLQKRVEAVVELVDWDPNEVYERLGMEEKFTEYLGVKIPLIRLPIYPGKNVTVIAESISLNIHLRIYGYNAARELSSTLSARLRDKKRINDYLRWDEE